MLGVIDNLISMDINMYAFITPLKFIFKWPQTININY